MSAEEQRIARKIAQAMDILPERERGYLLGYAECAAALAKAKPQEDTGQQPDDENQETTN